MFRFQGRAAAPGVRGARSAESPYADFATRTRVPLRQARNREPWCMRYVGWLGSHVNVCCRSALTQYPLEDKPKHRARLVANSHSRGGRRLEMPVYEQAHMRVNVFLRRTRTRSGN